MQEAERLMRGLFDTAEAAQRALLNPETEAKDSTAKGEDCIERLSEFVQAVIATPQGLDELSLRAAIVWGGTCQGSLTYQAGEAAQNEYRKGSRRNHDHELESESLNYWFSNSGLQPCFLREDVRQKIAHIDRMIELKLFGKFVLPLVKEWRKELNGIFHFAKLKEADGCHWLWHLTPAQLKKENAEHDPWLRLLKEGKANCGQHLAASIRELRRCLDWRCRIAGLIDPPPTRKEQGKLPVELLGDIPVSPTWINKDDPNPERLARVHQLAAVMLDCMGDIDYALNRLPQAESAWNKHFCEFENESESDFDWKESYDRHQSLEIAGYLSRLFKSHIEFRKHINLNSTYFSRAGDASQLPAWNGTPAEHWHHFLQLRSSACYNVMHNLVSAFTFDQWRAIPLDQIGLDSFAVLLENAMFMRHFAHGFKGLLSHDERTKLSRDLAGEYQRAVGQAQQAEILEKLKLPPTAQAKTQKAAKPKPEKLEPIVISADFSSVKWHGEQFQFTTNQSIVVKKLWPNLRSGLSMRKESLLDDDIQSEYLGIVFRGHPAWGRMILEVGKGAYRLADPLQPLPRLPMKKKASKPTKAGRKPSNKKKTPRASKY